MLFCEAGDIPGAMDRLYQDVSRFEALLGVRFDHVLHVGDFGVWPDPTRIDKATRPMRRRATFRRGSRESNGAAADPFHQR
jgi:diadenosine tetraphosphatase ApaH/serine/threonine PP2A family protein phosphatase